MPKLAVRKPDEVPLPNHASRSVQEQRQLYENFIRAAEHNVGELELGAGEQIRSTKVRLRRAAGRLQTELDIWDTDGRVYFRLAQRRRGRSRKST